MSNKRGYQLRFDDDIVYEELEYLATVLGMSKNKVINLLIRQEYGRYKDDPVISEYLSKLQAIKEILKDGAFGQTSLS